MEEREHCDSDGILSPSNDVARVAPAAGRDL